MMLPRVNIRAFKALTVLVCFGLIGLAGFARAQSADEDHQPSIRGIKIGMTAADVLERLGGRMPDGRKDEKEEAHLIWKLEEGNLLQVTFRGEHVSHLGLQYKNPRPTTDLWLLPLATKPTKIELYREERAAAARVGLQVGNVGTETTLTAVDPRLRRDYKPTETHDKMRAVWTRQEKAEAGYRIEIQFLSSSRKQFGDRFGEYVEFKYVTIPPEDVKKFEEATRARGRR